MINTLKDDPVPVNTPPVWKELPEVSALLLAPGQYLSIDLDAEATDAEGDTVYYYAELGYLNGSEFWQMPEMGDILLWMSDGHLVGGVTLWDLTPSRDYLLRVYADDNFGDTVPGVSFDVPVTVSAPGNSAPFTLVPDGNVSDDLLSTFNAGSMAVGRLYDDDGDPNPDRLKLFSYWYDANLEIESETLGILKEAMEAHCPFLQMLRLAFNLLPFLHSPGLQSGGGIEKIHGLQPNLSIAVIPIPDHSIPITSIPPDTPYGLKSRKHDDDAWWF